MLNQQKLEDAVSLAICILAGCAWGWVLAGCWIAHLKDLKKERKEKK